MNTTPRKRALVTGGSGDLGGALCRRLARDGLHVIVHANGNLARAEALAAEILAANGSAEAIAFDVADGDASRAAIEGIAGGRRTGPATTGETTSSARGRTARSPKSRSTG